MAMTNVTMSPKVEPNAGTPEAKAQQPLSAQEILKAAEQIKTQAKEDPLAGIKEGFEDEVAFEANKAQKILAEQQQAQGTGKQIAELVEDDAYNLNINIVAKMGINPSFLKVELKDANYIARWCNRHELRQTTLAGQGFTRITRDEIANIDTLDMFEDARGNFVWYDMICMKVQKNVYYAGLRRAYLKSLHATNDRKAREAGAAFAASNLTSTLSGPERAYLAQEKISGNNTKPIYNPNIGV